MIMTPIKAFSGGEESSLQRPLLSSESKSAAPGSHLSGGGGGEAESGTSVIAKGDLPGQFTRVMGKGEQRRSQTLVSDQHRAYSVFAPPSLHPTAGVTLRRGEHQLLPAAHRQVPHPRGSSSVYASVWNLKWSHLFFTLN